MNRFSGSVLSLGFLMAGLYPATAAAWNTEVCTTRSAVHRLASSDKRFAAAADRVNAHFRMGGTVKSAVSAIPEGDIVGRDARYLVIEARTSTCAATRTGIARRDAATDCNYVGCTEDIGPDYSGMPPGSEVKISTCSNRVKTERRYMRASNGNWVLVGYSTVFVDECKLD